MSSRLSPSVLVLPIAALVAGCNPPASANGTGMNFMSQDLGVGGDLAAVLAAAPADQPTAADSLWAQKDTASFTVRVGPIADAVKRRSPDVLGVQSAMQWRLGTTVASDYLDDLVAALAARGLTYTPVATATTADLTLTGASGNVYRVTDREAILVRAGVAASMPAGGTFVAHRSVSIAGASVPYARGWASVQVSIGGKSFRVVSAHLDDVDAATQAAQATELVKVALPGPVIVMGGLGADADNTAWAGYAIVSAQNTRLFDAAAYAGAAYPTCCRDPALVDPKALLDRREDVVFMSSDFTVWSASRELGNNSTMVDGIWPSSHGGVVAGLYLQ